MERENETTARDMGGCFVVTYRDRAEHLKKFIAHYTRIIPEIPIYVIHQADNKPFNRAKLFNAGFLELENEYDYFILHDVDLILDEKKSDPYATYAFPECIIHCGTNLGQFGYKMPCPDFFGGVTVISKRVMRELNGWSNECWGWGNEEEMFQEDALSKGYGIDRRVTYYHSLPHKRNIDANLLKESGVIRRAGKDNESDGLSHCKYEVVSRESKNGYELINVHL